MCLRLSLLGLSLCASGLAAQQGPIVISEFMASNGLTLQDQHGDWPDWIEICNSGSAVVDLGGWYLTDSAKSRTKWAFPRPTLIGPQGCLVVFASGKDLAVAGKELHTSFSLKAAGEYLALAAPDQRVVSEFTPTYPPQFSDVWYGVAPGGQRFWLATPTPGKANGAPSPIIGTVRHVPLQPTSNDEVTVTAELLEPPGTTTSTVTLYHRRGFAPEVTLAMRDDGKNGDLVAGDGIWTAKIPRGAPPGSMLRWRAVATFPGGSAKAPLYKSATESPEYLGTMVQDAAVSSQLPVLFWFVQYPAQAETLTGTRCSLYHLNELYDNVLVHRRGGSSVGWPKKNFKLDFNRGHRFRFDPREEPVEEINLSSTWSDKSFVRQILAYETYDRAGAAGSMALPVRVQQNGGFYSVAILLEEPDQRLLEREGLDPRGALYKMYNTLDSATSRVEKKTRQHENNSDLQGLVTALGWSGPALERYLFDNVDVPAVLSYIAATVLMHDQDHVHKNYFLYRDTEGDLEWRFLPWDKDLTFGRNYSRTYGVLNDLMTADKDPASHPLFGDRNHTNPGGRWNRLIDAFHRTPRLRTMYLRRLRTVMDDLLQDLGTPRQQRDYEQRMDALAVQMGPDVALDKARWGIPSYWDRTIDFAKGRARVESFYLVPRRNHLFVTHGSSSTGIIPPPQSPAVGLSFGDIVDSPLSNDPDEEYVEIVNCNAIAVDLSGWELRGGVSLTFPPGMVIAPHDAVYASPHPRRFRARTRGPGGNQGLLVVGPYAGHLGPAETLDLYDARGRPVATVGGFEYRLSSTGAGDIDLRVAGTTPHAELFVLFSAVTQHRIGCGPLLGLGVDALWSVSLPLGTPPFHVLADASGDYRFQAGANTLPRGLTLDSRVASFDRTRGIVFSPIRRVKF